MQFQVPQFIEVEDKLFGPLTLKQFVYLAGGAGICFMCYAFLPIYLSIPVMMPFAGLALALAFYKINSKPFIDILEAATKYYVHGKLYIWQKKPRIATKSSATESAPTNAYVPRLSDSKLKDLAWSLDIQESVYSRPEQRK